MNRTTLPINEITSIDRQRLDLGDIADLADSIKRFGLIQPIVINQDKRLIAGGRRLAAHKHLGLTHIDVVYRETLSADELHELELEENVRRKEMSWQEKCLNIAKIHSLKKKRSAIEGDKWGMEQTGEMLGIAKVHVHYNNEIANRLNDPKTKERYWACANMAEAWRLRMRDEEEALQASLAKEMTSTYIIQQDSISKDQLNSEVVGLANLLEVPTEESGVDFTKALADEAPISFLRTKPYITLTRDEAKRLYLSNELNPPDGFDTYYKEKIESIRASAIEVINLTQRLHHRSCIDFMLDPGWAESMDHIITDPPYGIEMSNLAQGNTGMNDIDTVVNEHDVESNQDLFTQFFPAAYQVLKPNGFLILWCDIMQWQRLYDLAIKVGFKVQRWPVTWVKTHRCMNQMANFNFTKSTEIAMVCRKGTATLVELAGECHILAAHDEYKDTLGHPFVKPFDVWSYLIDHISFEGQTILEPFAGRGSGVLSIIRKNRRVYACELNEQHYNALLENVKQHYLKLNPNYQFK